MASREVNFLAFFLIWAKLQGWKVPLLHVRICQWLDTCDARVRVLMVEGRDYRVEGNEVVFDDPPGDVLDICAGCAWPERFTREEIAIKRQETRTLNAWDSQYQLEAKPISDIRLDPARIIPYDCDPVIRIANGEVGMWLGATRIVGAVAYWDCSLGKIKSDASAFTLLLTDALGQLYWHVSQGLTGDLAVKCGPAQLLKRETAL